MRVRRFASRSWSAFFAQSRQMKRSSMIPLQCDHRSSELSRALRGVADTSGVRVASRCSLEREDALTANLLADDWRYKGGSCQVPTSPSPAQALGILWVDLSASSFIVAQTWPSRRHRLEVQGELCSSTHLYQRSSVV